MCPELGPEDRQLYVAVLEEIAGRIEAVRGLLLPPDPLPPNVELSALHLRKVLELIVMGSLVTNRTEIQAIAKALQRKKAREARELAKAANPYYWPKGTTAFGPPSSGPIEVQPAPGALREEEWDNAYGRLSELLHARNPFKKQIDLAAERVWLGKLRHKIMSLLEHHIVTLVDRDYMLIGLMRTDEGFVEVVMLARDSPTTARIVRS
jgi:hypothetical protein